MAATFGSATTQASLDASAPSPSTAVKVAEAPSVRVMLSVERMIPFPMLSFAETDWGGMTDAAITNISMEHAALFLSFSQFVFIDFLLAQYN